MTELSNTQKKKNARNYERAGVVDINVVLPLIADPEIKSVELHGHKVNVTSLRLRNFVKSTTCSGCGLQATHFAVENNTGYQWHLNLWAAVDGREVLFTHDHTLARSLGGADDEDNTTTMCRTCNARKAKQEQVEVCRLRGLPMPGTGRSGRVRRAKKNAVVVPMGTPIVKASGRKFKNDDYTAIPVALCSSLMDPRRRISYVLEDQSIINVELTMAK